MHKTQPKIILAMRLALSFLIEVFGMPRLINVRRASSKRLGLRHAAPAGLEAPPLTTACVPCV